MEDNRLNYSQICEIVGELYLQSANRSKMIDGKYQDIITDLQQRLGVLTTENVKLKEQLDAKK